MKYLVICHMSLSMAEFVNGKVCNLIATYLKFSNPQIDPNKTLTQLIKAKILKVRNLIATYLKFSNPQIDPNKTLTQLIKAKILNPILVLLPQSFSNKITLGQAPHDLNERKLGLCLKILILRKAMAFDWSICIKVLEFSLIV